MSLMRRHKAFHEALRAAAITPAAEGGLATTHEDLAPSGGTEAQLAMARLIFDKRRLKEIQSLERKIEAKREMLPEYRLYIGSLFDATAATGQGVQDEVLPTIMVWTIDVGDYAWAMELIEYVLRHNIVLPAQFERSAPTLVTEEIAEAALKQIGAGNDFDVDLLLAVDELVADHDMPDEVRAKLKKAIGLQLSRVAEKMEDGEGAAGAKRAAQEGAHAHLKRAVELDVRVGAKKEIEKLARALKPAPAPLQQDSGAPAAVAGEQLAPRRSAATRKAGQSKGTKAKPVRVSPPKTGG